MSQTTENFLPAATGQTLGNSGQRWDTYIQNAFVSGTLDAYDFNGRIMADQASGSSFSAKLTSAISALDSNGGVIDARGLEGSQTIASTITISKPVILFIGRTTLTWAGTVAAWNITSAGGVYIIGIHPSLGILHTTGTSSDGIIPANNFWIQNMTIRGPNSAASGFSGIDGSANDVRILNCVIEKWGSHGINSGGNSSRWIVSGNKIQDNLVDDGFLISGGATDFKVIDNYFTGNGAWGLDCNGSRCLIQGNSVYQNGGSGGADNGGIIVYGYVDGATYNANNNQVLGNYCRANAGPGIYVSAGAGATANDNLISENECLSNTGSGSNGDGILVGSGQGTYSGNQIKTNVCNSNQRAGIQLDLSAGTAAENEIVNNRCRSNTSYGVAIASGCTDTKFYDNTCLGNGQEIYEFGTRTRRRGNIVSTSNAMTAERGVCNVAAQFDKTNTTLADVTGLSVTVYQQKKYRFKACLWAVTSAGGGHKYAIASALSATNIIYTITSVANGGTAFVISSKQTSSGGSAGENSGTTAAYTVIEGEILVAAGSESGALTVQFAQNSASGTSSILIGSTFEVEQIPA